MSASQTPQKARLWPWVLGLIIAIIVIAVALVAAATVFLLRPDSHGGFTETNVAPVPTLTSVTPSPQGSSTSGGHFTGVAHQSSKHSRDWRVSIVFGAENAVISYATADGSTSCRGALIGHGEGPWKEYITQGACDTGGSWTFRYGTQGQLAGTYRPPKNNYLVQATLTLTKATVRTATTNSVATFGCTAAPGEPRSTVTVIDGAIVAVVIHPGHPSWVLVGDRGYGSKSTQAFADDDGVNITFASPTSDTAVEVIDC